MAVTCEIKTFSKIFFIIVVIGCWAWEMGRRKEVFAVLAQLIETNRNRKCWINSINFSPLSCAKFYSFLFHSFLLCYCSHGPTSNCHHSWFINHLMLISFDFIQLARVCDLPSCVSQKTNFPLSIRRNAWNLNILSSTYKKNFMKL
jgi:hypothetical protein